jgi:hypothetical protein
MATLSDLQVMLESYRSARRVRLSTAAWALAGLATAACGGVPRTARGAVAAFADAVQAGDFERLFCLSAGAAEAVELGDTAEARRAAFAAWAREQIGSYERGRDAGWVALDEHGVVLVRLFALGQGTFMSHTRSRRLGADVLELDSEIRFGYGAIDLSVFPAGTTLYLCGAPVGRVHAVRVPAGPGEVSAEVLETVRLRWTLARAKPSEGCTEAWAVASVEVVEGSAATTELTWMF